MPPFHARTQSLNSTAPGVSLTPGEREIKFKWLVKKKSKANFGLIRTQTFSLIQERIKELEEQQGISEGNKNLLENLQLSEQMPN